MQHISLDTSWAGCGIQHECRPYHPDLHPKPSRFAGAGFASCDILVFMDDDDEFPLDDMLNAAYDVIDNEGAQCAGRYISVNFSPHGRSAWLDVETTGFLSELNHGGVPFWIRNGSTPIWSSNIANDLRLFRDNPTLRFDRHYNQKNTAMGGGENTPMLYTFVSRGKKNRYRSDMVMWHFVKPWRLKRNCFLEPRHSAGVGHSRYSRQEYVQRLFGIPPFMLNKPGQTILGGGSGNSALAETTTQGALHHAAASRRKPGHGGKPCGLKTHLRKERLHWHFQCLLPRTLLMNHALWIYFKLTTQRPSLCTHANLSP